jgi:hypothetical protein
VTSRRAPDPDDLDPTTPEQRALLLRMGLVRLLRPYVVVGDLEVVVARVVDQLVADLEAIGFDLAISWDRTEPDP